MSGITAILLLDNFCSMQHTGMPDSESWMLAIHLQFLTHLVSHGLKITRWDDGWGVRQQMTDGMVPMVVAMPG